MCERCAFFSVATTQCGRLVSGAGFGEIMRSRANELAFLLVFAIFFAIGKDSSQAHILQDAIPRETDEGIRRLLQ